MNKIRLFNLNGFYFKVNGNKRESSYTAKPFESNYFNLDNLEKSVQVFNTAVATMNKPFMCHYVIHLKSASSKSDFLDKLGRLKVTTPHLYLCSLEQTTHNGYMSPHLHLFLFLDASKLTKKRSYKTLMPDLHQYLWDAYTAPFEAFPCVVRVFPAHGKLTQQQPQIKLLESEYSDAFEWCSYAAKTRDKSSLSGRSFFSSQVGSTSALSVRPVECTLHKTLDGLCKLSLGINHNEQGTVLKFKVDFIQLQDSDLIKNCSVQAPPVFTTLLQLKLVENITALLKLLKTNNMTSSISVGTLDFKRPKAHVNGFNQTVATVLDELTTVAEGSLFLALAKFDI